MTDIPSDYKVLTDKLALQFPRYTIGANLNTDTQTIEVWCDAYIRESDFKRVKKWLDRQKLDYPYKLDRLAF